MALPETLPFTLGWITPATATIAATVGTATVTAPDTVSPSTATITAAPGTPTVTSAVTVSPDTATIAATPGTSTVTAPDSIAPPAAPITAAPGTPVVTAPNTVSPSGVTITAAPGLAAVNVVTPPGGMLPWTLPFRIGGPNVIDVPPAQIAAVPGTPTVAGAPAQAPLPWKLPIILGGNQTLFPAAGARTTLTPGTAVISGTGFPYQFPFTFAADTVFIYPPTSATITAQPGTPRITGGKPAVTPTGVAMYALPGTPTVTGPSRQTLTPGSATIITARGTPTVRTVQSTTTVFLCDGNQNFLDWHTGAFAPTPDNPIISTVASLINSETCTVAPIAWPESLPQLDGLNIGANNLAVAIANCDTDFILVGFSQGAAICSMALQQMQNGGLTNYAPQCIGAVMFGNPCRQGAAIAPVQTDPGGHGIWATNLITHTPTWWWEFVLPKDIANTIPNTLFGRDVSSIFTTLLASYTGGGNLVRFILDHLGRGVQIDAQAIGQLTLLFASIAGIIPPVPGQPGFAAHGAYHDTAPPGATLTCAQLAANYINGLTANKPVTRRTIIPQGATVTATAGTPFISAVVSPGGDTITATGGTPTVTAPAMVIPTGATILAIPGSPDRLPGDLPWTLPVALGA